MSAAAQTVPEAVLKKRRRDEEWAAKKAADAAEVRQTDVAFAAVREC